MTNAFRSVEDYEFFVYSLSGIDSVQSSTVTVIRVGASIARVIGEILFAENFRLVVRERIFYDREPLLIDEYGYEVWNGEEKLCWYDPQPHPHVPALKKNHPHHKHIPPDIKHNRVPAPEMSFTQPNLPVLIREIEALIQAQTQGDEKATEQEN